MRHWIFAVTLSGCGIAPSAAALADARATNIYAGIQSLALAGVHRDIADNQYGIAGGALFQFGIRSHRFELRAEGVPPVSLPQRASATYGQATPHVSLFDSVLLVTLDRKSRLSAGAGMLIVNQRTPLPNLSQVVSSRLSGIRYEVAYRAPLRGSVFAQFDVAGSPSLSGGDRFTLASGQPAPDKNESASEIDAMVAIGVERGPYEILFGVRTLNFSARFTADSSAADRNNGAGLLLELRRSFGR